MFCSKVGVSTELNVPTPYPSLLGLLKRCSLAFSKQKSVGFLCTKRYLPCEKFGAFEGRTFDLFEKKNSKSSNEKKKKRKERKKDECVFCLFFSLAKKKFVSFTQHTQTSNIKLLVIFIRRTKDTLYIFIIIIIYK